MNQDAFTYLCVFFTYNAYIPKFPEYLAQYVQTECIDLVAPLRLAPPLTSMLPPPSICQRSSCATRGSCHLFPLNNASSLLLLSLPLSSCTINLSCLLARITCFFHLLTASNLRPPQRVCIVLSMIGSSRPCWRCVGSGCLRISYMCLVTWSFPPPSALVLM